MADDLIENTGASIMTRPMQITKLYWRKPKTAL